MTDLRILAGVVTAFATVLLPTRVLATEPLQEVQYSAVFQSKNTANASPTSLRLIIGMPEKSNPKNSTKLVAQIWSGSECRATCDVKRFTDETVDLQCHSTEMPAFSTHMMVNLAQPTLQLGTWLQGYEQAALKVGEDQLSVKESVRYSDTRDIAMFNRR